MTLPQLRIYAESVGRLKTMNHLNSISAVRVAHHADTDEYSRITNEILREIK